MPATGPAKVERVRNDGQWLYGDRLDMDYRPWRIDGRTVLGVPRLILERWTDAAPAPVVPGWEYHRYSGMVAINGYGKRPTLMGWLEYTPIECIDPTAPPKQLELF